MAEDAVKRLVVFGGSAGSLEVLLQLVPHLPANAGACYVMVVHRKYDADSVMENLLSFRTKMPVKEVEDKEPLKANAIFIAPADYHLLLENDGAFSLDSSEKINYSRPSIDVTFESAAMVFGDRVVGILLSGANADGAYGLQCIKHGGGITIVQNPQTAEVAFMPMQAVKRGVADHVLDVDSIPSFIAQLLLNDRRTTTSAHS